MMDHSKKKILTQLEINMDFETLIIIQSLRKFHENEMRNK